MQTVKYIPTQIHTRQLDRLVAHRNMKKAGFSKINKKEYHTVYSITGNPITIADGSYFSRNWRGYV